MVFHPTPNAPVALLALPVWWAMLWGHPCALRAADAPAKESAEPIRMAVLDFQTELFGPPVAGEELAGLLSSALSTGERTPSLLDRKHVREVLKEQSVNLTGLADPEQALKCSTLLGAQLLVSGRAYEVGAEIWISAALFSAQTGKLEKVLVKGLRRDGVSGLTAALAEKLKQKIAAKGAALMGTPQDLAAELASLSERLKGRALPVNAVWCPSAGTGSGTGVTEALFVLRRCGYRVRLPALPAVDPSLQADPGKHLQAIVAAVRKGGAQRLLTVSVESSAAPSVEGLVGVSCKATCRAVDASNGAGLGQAEASSRAADTSEAFARQQALENSVDRAMLELLRRLDLNDGR